MRKTLAEMKEFHADSVRKVERCTPEFIEGQEPSNVLKELDLQLPKYAEEYLVFRPDQKDILETAYVNWLVKANRWLQDENNVFASYQFLDGHPIFWACIPDENTDVAAREYERGEAFDIENHAKTNVFETTGYCQEFWKALGGNTKNPTYMMECGSAIAPSRYGHYHDISLDSYAKSFDECYVNTAFYVFALHAFTEDTELDESYREYFSE